MTAPPPRAGPAAWRAAVALSLLAGCGSVRLPGGQSLGEAVRREAGRTGEQVGRNVVRMAATGELSKTATFDMQQEFWLGRSVAAETLARLGGRPLPPEHPIARYLRDVGTVVAFAAAGLREADDRPYPLRGYRFIPVESGQVNAVGMPGGFVAVTTGLVRAVESEDELAAVLAHEIAHVQRGHVMEPVEAARRQEHLTREMLAGTSPAVHAFFGKVVTLGTDLVLDRGFGKANELEADRWAVRFLAAAGYDPAALRALLTRLTGRSARGGFFDRHPPAADRAAALSQAEPARRGDPGVRRPRFARAASGI